MNTACNQQVPKPLSALREGEKGVITSLHTNAAFTARLCAVGFTAGTTVECVKYKKDSLTALKARGAVTAVRLRDADLIMVKDVS